MKHSIVDNKFSKTDGEINFDINLESNQIIVTFTGNGVVADLPTSKIEFEENLMNKIKQKVYDINYSCSFTATIEHLLYDAIKYKPANFADLSSLALINREFFSEFTITFDEPHLDEEKEALAADLCKAFIHTVRANNNSNFNNAITTILIANND